MAANLTGTYKNPSTGETLVITEYYDGNGTFSGTFSGRADGMEFNLKVNGTYHFFNSVGNPTSISFSVQQPSTDTSPELREAWVGTTDASNYRQFQMMGVRSLLKNASGESTLYALSGPFIRQ
jgi:hypothetical protein